MFVLLAVVLIGTHNLRPPSWRPPCPPAAVCARTLTANKKQSAKLASAHATRLELFAANIDPIADMAYFVGRHGRGKPPNHTVIGEKGGGREEDADDEEENNNKKPMREAAEERAAMAELLPLGAALDWDHLSRLSIILQSSGSFGWAVRTSLPDPAAAAASSSTSKGARLLGGGGAAGGSSAASGTAPPPGVVLVGVVKKTSGLSTKRRTLVLNTRGELMYFDADKGEQKGTIRLDAVVEVVLKSNSKQGAFDVVVSGRTYKFAPAAVTTSLGDDGDDSGAAGSSSSSGGGGGLSVVESPSAARWVCAIESARIARRSAAARSLRQAAATLPVFDVSPSAPI